MHKKLILISILFFTYHILFASKKAQIKQVPSWINKIDIPNKKNTGEEEVGIQYLLIDFQVNVAKQSEFTHLAYELSNSESVKSGSDISVNYDPSYQKLAFHYVRILRGDKQINKLALNKIKTIQREQSMDRLLYDGSYTAVINLTDVRPNDIIEYAYTIEGFNPINNGNYSTSFYHEFYNKVSKYYNRVITKHSKPLTYKRYNGAKKPEIIKTSNRIYMGE